MKFDPITDDPVPDTEYPALLTPVTFESQEDLVLGVLLQAQGKGPHPTIVLLHGFPGNERNFDLAHIFRRAGWNVLVFHYRGSWGSCGSYSFTHVLEDVPSALTFLRCSGEKLRVNPHKIVLIGHSLGGFAALMTAVTDVGIQAVVSIAGVNIGYFVESILTNHEAVKGALHFFQEGLPPLQNTSPENLISEAIANAKSWNLLEYVTTLCNRSLLLIGASRDETAPTKIHHQPLVQALRNENAQNLSDIVLDADHLFSDKRITLARTILSWLENHERR